MKQFNLLAKSIGVEKDMSLEDFRLRLTKLVPLPLETSEKVINASFNIYQATNLCHRRSFYFGLENFFTTKKIKGRYIIVIGGNQSGKSNFIMAFIKEHDLEDFLVFTNNPEGFKGIEKSKLKEIGEREEIHERLTKGLSEGPKAVFVELHQPQWLDGVSQVFSCPEIVVVCDSSASAHTFRRILQKVEEHNENARYSLVATKVATGRMLSVLHVVVHSGVGCAFIMRGKNLLKFSIRLVLRRVLKMSKVFGLAVEKERKLFKHGFTGITFKKYLTILKLCVLIYNKTSLNKIIQIGEKMLPLLTDSENKFIITTKRSRLKLISLKIGVPLNNLFMIMSEFYSFTDKVKILIKKN